MPPKLKVPEHITLPPLPPQAPEPDPVENIWQFLRENRLSNRRPPHRVLRQDSRIVLPRLEPASRPAAKNPVHRLPETGS